MIVCPVHGCEQVFFLLPSQFINLFKIEKELVTTLLAVLNPGFMLSLLPVLDVAHAVLDLAPLLRRHLPLVERGQEVGRGLLGVVDQPPVGDDLVVEGLGPVQLRRGVSLVRLRDFGTELDSHFGRIFH